MLRTPRVMQLEGLFELPPNRRSEVAWHVDLPIERRDWNIGLIVGPSGSGKSTLAREMFGAQLVNGYEWPADASIIDAFPKRLGIKEITGLLSSVGFSSPPSWLRPFGVLSNGEQFRVTVARALAEATGLTVLDEFTSVIDRTVAQIGSAAVARTVRQRKAKLIAVSCHYDIVEWLQPDWIYQPHINEFQWRELQRRPPITLTIQRVDKAAWQLFRHNHYLDTELNHSARCFVASIDEVPVAFCACLSFPHATRPGWRLHRLVTLPDYQGVGIGVALSDFVGGLYRATGKPVFRTASHPAVVAHCAKSRKWDMYRVPRRSQPSSNQRGSSAVVGMISASNRLTAGFEYVGQARPEEARGFGLIN